MQVSSINGSLQNRYFSGTGSIGGIHLPDFNDKYVFSKKKSGTSEEEYRKKIREQAYEDFAKGQFQSRRAWRFPAGMTHMTRRHI